jgi:hypothetical protein
MVDAMIFTFGHRQSYDSALQTAADQRIKVNKIGCNDDYPGGSVWRTRAEAQAYLDSLPNEDYPNWQAADFAVYGVLADWDADTYQHKHESWRSLLRDAELVQLEIDP